MAYNFLTGREYLRRKKLKERKKLISVALGFPDLVFAVGGVPVFPIRMQSFKMNALLMALNSAKSILGWNLFSKVLDIARKFDVLKLSDQILDDVINTINEMYNQAYESGIDSNLDPDLCYGINTLYGMHKSKGKNVDANLNFAMRCGEWNKISESLKSLVPNQIWIDMPSKEVEDDEKVLEIIIENIKSGINKLENLTGNYISDESLKKQFRISNQVKRYYKTILYEISASNFYPCNPATFAEILALLTITFQDYNSNPQRYLENISHLVNEMRDRIRKGIGTDVTKSPLLLFSPIYSGWDPQIHEIIYKLGARVIYADWDIFGLLEEIPVSNNTNPVENYAKFLLNASRRGIGCDREYMINSYLNSARELKVDGLIFNQVFGCPSTTEIYESVMRKIKFDLDIPTTVIEFRKIGENIDQNKLGPFIESLK
jgi:benzoyl-CoA reductase/2-hydroxyglutaryl-CoA dehydratase subunit BcrC/BadD/HgdB